MISLKIKPMDIINRFKVIHGIHDSETNLIYTEHPPGDNKEWFCISFKSPNQIQTSDGTKWHREGIASEVEIRLQQETVDLRKEMLLILEERHKLELENNKLRQTVLGSQSSTEAHQLIIKCLHQRLSRKSLDILDEELIPLLEYYQQHK